MICFRIIVKVNASPTNRLFFRDLIKHLHFRGFILKRPKSLELGQNEYIVKENYTNQLYHILINEVTNDFHDLELDVSLVDGDSKHLDYDKFLIRFILEDYFKIHSNLFFYIETLTNNQIDLISKIGREIHPIQIQSKLDSHHFDYETKMPDKIYETGDGNWGTFLYAGDKYGFGDIVSFWLCFKNWILGDNIFEYQDVNGMIYSNYFNEYLGCCIPLDSDSKIIASEVLPVLRSVDTAIDFESVKYYNMSTDWEDQLILISDTSNYMIYNWWTTN